MTEWKIDIPVLCIFFARPKLFEKCFEAVRKARPKTLLLWQDGPRERRLDDIENIEKCRKIAENIDWECEVYKNYHDKNMGCDPSTFYSHKWAFSIVDKCIILEDDLIPSQSFFTFCKEMLYKYENDERIDRICGRNNLGQYDIPYDYFFARNGNSWGWASWKRVAEKWEENYDFLEDKYTMDRVLALTYNHPITEKWIKQSTIHKNEKIPYWEHIIGGRTLLDNTLCIYPKVNLVSNWGLDENSTHAPNSVNKLSKKRLKFFTLPAYNLEFPLKHPKYFIDDRIFFELCKKKYKENIFEIYISKFKRVLYK